MNARFVELLEAADKINGGSCEVVVMQSEISDIVRRRSIFGQRIKNVPATGHPSRTCVYYHNMSTPPAQVEQAIPLKALLVEVPNGVQTISNPISYLTAKDLYDAVDHLMRTHDVALWHGNDTSFSKPTTVQYFGVMGQIENAPNSYKLTVEKEGQILPSFKSFIELMVEDGETPTAIYANPVLLDLLDRETKKWDTTRLSQGVSVKTFEAAGLQINLIPEWALSYSGIPGSGSAELPAYIVTENLIEYHWLTDPNPRIFQSSAFGSIENFYVVVKFGAVAALRAGRAHRKVTVKR